jgi:hypothetical protein
MNYLGGNCLKNKWIDLLEKSKNGCLFNSTAKASSEREEE